MTKKGTISPVSSNQINPSNRIPSINEPREYSSRMSKRLDSVASRIRSFIRIPSLRKLPWHSEETSADPRISRLQAINNVTTLLEEEVKEDNFISPDYGITNSTTPRSSELSNSKNNNKLSKNASTSNPNQIKIYPKNSHKNIQKAIMSANKNDGSSSKSQKIANASNAISTTKYNIYNFIPKNLYEQITVRWANIYFILIACLNWLPWAQVLSPILGIFPVSFILSVTMIKDAFEDYKRYKTDSLINSEKCRVYDFESKKFIETTWENLRPGDIIRIYVNEQIPADVLVLFSSDENNSCYLSTSNLDGESNLKQFNAIDLGVDRELPTPSEMSPERSGIHSRAAWDVQNSEIYSNFEKIIVNQPTAILDDIIGLLHVKQIPPVEFRSGNVLLRGCTLRNSDYVEAAVLYTGKYTKTMMNQKQNKRKNSKLEKEINRLLPISFVVMIVLALTLSIGTYFAHVNILENPDTRIYFPDRSKTPWQLVGENFVTFFISIQTIVPIALYVTWEIVKFAQTHFIEVDNKMYDRTKEDEQFRYARCNSLNITEDLGQIDYIFSDKTGTLTENKMVFKLCTIAGIRYHDKVKNKKFTGSISRYRRSKSKASIKFLQSQETESQNYVRKKAELDHLHRLRKERETPFSVEKFDSQMDDQTLKNTQINAQAKNFLKHRRQLSVKVTRRLSTSQTPSTSPKNPIDRLSKQNVLKTESLPEAVKRNSKIILENPQITTTATGQTIVLPAHRPNTSPNVHENSDSRHRRTKTAGPNLNSIVTSRSQSRDQKRRLRQQASVHFAAVAPEFEKPVDFETDHDLIRKVQRGGLEQYHQLYFLCLTLCHSALIQTDMAAKNLEVVDEETPENELENEKIIEENTPKEEKSNSNELNYEAESPDELALLEFCQAYNYTMTSRTKEHIIIKVPGNSEKTFKILHFRKFTSKNKRMAIIVEEVLSKQIYFFIKGADEVILDLTENSVAENAKRIRSTTIDHIDSYAAKGLRTLCMAYRVLSQEEYDHWFKTEYRSRQKTLDESIIDTAYDSLENSNQVHLLGGTGIEDKLQDKVPKTIDFIRESGIKLWVITGDKMETAINIGYSSKLLNHNEGLCQIHNASNLEEVLQKMSDFEINFRKSLSGQDGDLPLIKKVEDSLSEDSDSSDEKTESPRASPAMGKSRVSKIINRRQKHQMAAQKPIKSVVKKSDAFSLAIDGKSLELLFNDPSGHGKRQFLDLISKSNFKTAIICRATPKMKAEVVKTVRKAKNVNTLSIGDGANDVAMIQEANIGVGIFGNEGLQAASNSDFAIAKFHFLKRLIFVHGLQNYERSGTMLTYFIKKHYSVAIINIPFICYAAFFTSVALDELYFATIATIYNGLHPIINGIFDQIFNENILEQNPKLYKFGQKNTAFNIHEFLFSAIYSALAALYTFYGSYLLINDSHYDGSFHAMVVFVALILFHWLIGFLDIKNWTYVHFYATLVYVLGGIGLMMIASLAYLPIGGPYQSYGAFAGIFNSPDFWFLTIMLTSWNILPYLLILTIRNYGSEMKRMVLRNRKDQKERNRTTRKSGVTSCLIPYFGK